MEWVGKLTAIATDTQMITVGGRRFHVSRALWRQVVDFFVLGDTVLVQYEGPEAKALVRRRKAQDDL
jgi:hypothetical protein